MIQLFLGFLFLIVIRPALTNQLCSQQSIITVVGQVTGSVTCWKYRLSTNTTNDPTFDKWFFRRKPKSGMMRVSHCLHFELSSIVLSHSEIVESTPGSFVEISLYLGSNISSSSILVSYRVHEGFSSKPYYVSLVQEDCANQIHLISFFDGVDRWNAYSISAYNVITSKRETLLFENVTSHSFSMASFVCVESNYETVLFHLYSSDDSGWNHNSYVYYLSKENKIINTFTLNSAVESYLLEDIPDYSNVLLPISVVMTQEEVAPLNLTLVIDSGSESYRSLSATSFNGIRLSSIEKSSIIPASSYHLYFNYNVYGRSSFNVSITIRIGDKHQHYHFSQSGTAEFDFLVPNEVCSSTWIDNTLLPAGVEGSVWSVLLPLNRTIEYSCNEGRWVMKRMSDCECLSFVDEWGIDWPQSPKNNLIQKPCKENWIGSVVSWCNEQCVWERIAGFCETRYCKKEIGSGVLWNETKANSWETVHCTDGTGTALSRYCNPQGEWESVEFGRCVCPAEMEWPATQSNHYHHIPCPAGYQGSTRRRCDRFGVWGPVQYDCVSVACPAEQIGNTFFPATLSGEVSKQPCPYPFHGWLMRECNSEGKWGEIVEDCESDNCTGFFFSLGNGNDLEVRYQNPEQSFDTLKGDVVPYTVGTVTSSTTSLMFKGLLPHFPYQVTVQAFQKDKVIAKCIIGGVYVGLICMKMERPILEKVIIKKDRARAVLHFIFPDCKNKQGDQLLINLYSETCHSKVDRIHSIDCSELGGCIPFSAFSYTLPDSLYLNCEYSVRLAVITEAQTTTDVWSDSLIFRPSRACIQWDLQLEMKTLSSYFGIITCHIKDTLFPSSIRMRYRSSSHQSTMHSQKWIPTYHEVCGSIAMCFDKKSISVPIERTNVWFEVEVVMEMDHQPVCHQSKTQRILYFAPAYPAAEVQLLPQPSYCIVDIRENIMPLYFAYVVENILGEVQLSSQQYIPYNNSEPLRIGPLHPNSRYFLSYNLVDFAGSVATNRTVIITSPRREVELNVTILSDSFDAVVFRYSSSVEGLLYCSVVMDLSLSSKTIQQSSVLVGVSHTNKDSFSYLPSSQRAVSLSCYLRDLLDSFYLVASPVKNPLHPVYSKAIKPVFYSPPLDDGMKPFNVTVSIVFSGPIKCTTSIVELLIVAHPFLSVRVLPTQFDIISPVEIAFSVFSIQSGILTSVLLPSRNIILSATTNRPVAFDTVFSGLPMVYRFSMESDVFLTERALSVHKAHSLLLEDSLELDYPFQDLKFIPSLIILQSVTSIPLFNLTIPHPCMSVQKTENGSVLIIHLLQCFDSLKIETSYRLVFDKPFLIVSSRYVMEPIPIPFYINGTHTPLRLVSHTPTEVMKPTESLTLFFNQPVQMSSGGLKVYRYLTKDRTVLLDSWTVLAKEGMISISQRDQITFNATALGLQPNSVYRIVVMTTIVRNKQWSSIVKSKELTMILHTTDDHCRYTPLFGMNQLSKQYALCSYDDTMYRGDCICQYVIV